MTIGSDRIVKRFYIGGDQDQQAGVNYTEGFETFSEAVAEIETRYNWTPPPPNILYVTECYRILKEA